MSWPMVRQSLRWFDAVRVASMFDIAKACPIRLSSGEYGGRNHSLRRLPLWRGRADLNGAFPRMTLMLLGMMIVVAHLKVSGAFRALGAVAIEHAHAPFMLLVMVTLLTGVLSAFLVNDAICLVMAPIVVHVTRVVN
ncbi:MAG: hypothetical protein E5W01_00715, partial [Mesorhizobium sp.]